MQTNFDIFSIHPISNEIFAKVSDELNCSTSIANAIIKSGGSFKFQYEVWIKTDQAFSLRQRVDFTKALARYSGTEILISDEDINPYLFIYLRPNEEAFTIVVDSIAYEESDELKIDDFYSLGWGMFALEGSLTASDEDWIIQRFSRIIPSLQLRSVDSKLFNPYFRRAQEKVLSLKDFSHYYLLSPPHKSIWYSKEEKSKLAIECLNDFHLKTKLPVCAFPVNQRKIENIPGGSDSEEFCIFFNDSKVEKIIYKERRKSW